MPELPEVETVRRSLQKLLPEPVKIERVLVFQPALREKVNAKEVVRLQGESLQEFHRRAKYLLWETEKYMIISHLGMTGSWRVLSEAPRKHDHLIVQLSSGQSLVYNDPRRFGLFRVIEKGNWQEAPYFRDLGPEPLGQQKNKGTQFNADYLYCCSRGRRMAVKSFLMDQKVVVGIGNIYASEALFRAGVKPQRYAGRISKEDYRRIVEESRRVLNAALKMGGSTIRDYRHVEGSRGEFVQKLLVYDRAGKPCRRCQRPIRQLLIGGRSSFWCAQCQK